MDNIYECSYHGDRMQLYAYVIGRMEEETAKYEFMRGSYPLVCLPTGFEHVFKFARDIDPSKVKGVSVSCDDRHVSITYKVDDNGDYEVKVKSKKITKEICYINFKIDIDEGRESGSVILLLPIVFIIDNVEYNKLENIDINEDSISKRNVPCVIDDSFSIDCSDENIKINKDGSEYHNVNRGYNGYNTKVDDVDIWMADKKEYCLESRTLRLNKIEFTGNGCDKLIVLKGDLNSQSRYISKDGKLRSKITDRNARQDKLVMYVLNTSNVDKYEFMTDVTINNKLSLLPVRGGQGYVGLTLFWDKQESAASYTVEFYKATAGGATLGDGDFAVNYNFAIGRCDMYYKISDKAFLIKDVQFMLKDTVDRNKCYYSLMDLPAGYYVARVFAEDRSGNIIYKSEVKALSL